MLALATEVSPDAKIGSDRGNSGGRRRTLPSASLSDRFRTVTRAGQRAISREEGNSWLKTTPKRTGTEREA